MCKHIPFIHSSVNGPPGNLQDLTYELSCCSHIYLDSWNVMSSTCGKTPPAKGIAWSSGISSFTFVRTLHTDVPFKLQYVSSMWDVQIDKCTEMSEFGRMVAARVWSGRVTAKVHQTPFWGQESYGINTGSVCKTLEIYWMVYFKSEYHVNYCPIFKTQSLNTWKINVIIKY